MKILAVGDSYMPTHYFRRVFVSLEDTEHDVTYLQVDDKPFAPATLSELRIKEYQGAPEELCKHMAGVDVLVVHGAPVTDAVLDASSALKLVGCARGGPVNVDVEAVTARRLPLVNTPGKNAEAVADQTLAFLVMLARGFPRAQRFLEKGHQLKDNWEGARFIGSDLRRHTLGLVGYGQVGQRVGHRALAFGMTVIAYDPYLDFEPSGEIEQMGTLDELLERADFVSVHARATSENRALFDAVTFAKMKPGSYFVNTARETLVDEDALDSALASGQLGGAALDVVTQSAIVGRHRLLRHGNVVMTPHIGGATQETLLQGAEMLLDEVKRFCAGEPMRFVVNPEIDAR
jgi:D-3-phosphoglycerate dehydrogenase / 2-oxoglutarate reductase